MTTLQAREHKSEIARVLQKRDGDGQYKVEWKVTSEPLVQFFNSAGSARRADLFARVGADRELQEAAHSQAENKASSARVENAKAEDRKDNENNASLVSEQRGKEDLEAAPLQVKSRASSAGDKDIKDEASFILL